ncbi:MAG: prevent-host-death protein [Thermoanaerobaculia bacterium]
MPKTVTLRQKPMLEDPDLFEGGEPVLVTRQGKVSGLYVPLENPEQVPDDLRRDLLAAVGRYVGGVLEDQGVSEKEILADFSNFRRRRR